MRLVQAAAFGLLALLLAACHEVGEDNEGGGTCLGYGSPSLLVVVKDSVTLAPVSDAQVRVEVPRGDSTEELSAPWDESRQGYYLSAGLGLEGGLYSAEASHPNYQTAATSEEFEEEGYCGALNEWIMELVVCPTGSSCP